MGLTTQTFDLLKDPHEMLNLAERPEHQARVRELTTLMKSWMRRTDDRVDLDKTDWGVPAAGG